MINGARTFTFGELAEEAAERSPPHDPPLRADGQGRLIGQPLQRLDGPAKANGSLRFAGDVRLPDMLFAAVRVGAAGRALRELRRAKRRRDARRSPRRRARAMGRGRRRQLVGRRARDQGREPDLFRRRAAAPTCGRCSKMRSPTATRKAWFRRGDYDATVEGSRPLAATYYVAPAQHLGLEPLTRDRAVRRRPARSLGGDPGAGACARARGRGGRIGASHVALYPMPVGAPSGRAMEADAVPYRRRARARAEGAGAGHPFAKREPEPRPRSRPARWRE